MFQDVRNITWIELGQLATGNVSSGFLCLTLTLGHL